MKQDTVIEIKKPEIFIDDPLTEPYVKGPERSCSKHWK